MGFAYATVVSTRELTPHLIRIEFSVPELDSVSLPGLADDAVAIFFGANGETPPPLELRNGAWGYFDIAEPPEGRNYSIRRIESAGSEDCTVVVDFVVHSHGVATTWAQNAKPGDTVLFTRGRGWYRPPNDAQHVVLGADLAGLPALARIVEELPRSVTATVLVEVPTAAELDYLEPREGVEVTSSIGTGNGDAPSALADLLAKVDLETSDGRYLWMACEAAGCRQVRKLARKESGWPLDRVAPVGYWRDDSERWMKKFGAVAAEMRAVYSNALAEGASESEASERFDEALEKAKL